MMISMMNMRGIMTKPTLDKEIVKMSYISTLNSISTNLTKKRIELANIQHRYFNEKLEMCTCENETRYKLEQEIEYIECELIRIYVEALAMFKKED